MWMVLVVVVEPSGDLVNAGGVWVDEAAVRDENLISSRGVSDLPAFCRTIIAALSEERAAPAQDEA